MVKANVAISLSKSLFEEVEAIASELEVSHSEVMELALAEFVRHYQNKQL